MIFDITPAPASLDNRFGEPFEARADKPVVLPALEVVGGAFPMALGGQDQSSTAAPSKARQKMRARSAATALERQNQHLPARWPVLSPGEVTAALTKLRTLASSSLQPLQRHGAHLLLASLITGRPTALLATLHVSLQTLESQGEALHLGDGVAVWHLQTAKLQSEQRIEEAARLQLERTTEHVQLHCLDWFAEIIRSDLERRTIGQSPRDDDMCLCPEDVVADDAVAAALKAITVGTGRLTAQRIEQWLPETIAKLPFGDLAVAALICGKETSAAANPLSYTWISLPEAQTLYLEAIRTLPAHCEAKLVMCDENLGVGSKYVPRKDAFQDLVAKLQERLSRPRDLSWQDQVEVHNAIYLYTTGMLSIAAATRGIREPMLRQSEVDLETGAFLISDKDALDGYNARRGWLVSMAIQQVRNFEDHLHALLPQLQFHDEDRFHALYRSLQPDTTVPIEQFLFFDSGTVIKDAGIKELKERCAEYGWHGPANAGRQYVRTNLRRICRPETVDTFMGHWQRGAEPFTFGSALDPVRYRKDLLYGIDKILKEDGWKPMRGLG